MTETLVDVSPSSKEAEPQPSVEEPVPGHPFAGPQGHRSDTMGSAVEASPERIRYHLRRPHAGRRGPLKMKMPVTPLAGQSQPAG